MRKVRIFGGPATKSFSLREENADVSPTHFEWITEWEPGEQEGKPLFATPAGAQLFQTRPELCNGAYPKVMLLVEPRCLRPHNYEWGKGGIIDIFLTYDKAFLEEHENARFYPFGGSSIAFDKWGIYPKSKDVCMFLSNKKTTEGHKLRHKIAEEFGDRIDVYSNFDSKFEILKDYRYCVVVESCWTDFYFSEKLIDPLSAGTIPFYCGLPNFHPILHGLKGLTKSFCYLNHTEEQLMFQLQFLHTEEDWATSYEKVWPERLDKIQQHFRQYAIMEDWIFEHYPDLFEEQC